VGAIPVLDVTLRAGPAGGRHDESKRVAMRTSRFGLVVAAICSLASCSLGGALSSPPVGSRLDAARAARPASVPSTLPLTLRNLSGIGRAFYYVVGLGTDGKWYRLARNGQLAPVLASDMRDGYADYSLPLPASGSLTLALPQLSAARMYLSLQRGLKVTVSDSNVPSSPPGWVASDPNYRTAFDWIEFTFDQTGWNGNTTAVDMYGLPLKIGLTGSSRQEVGTPPGGRSKIFKALESSAPFAALVIDAPAKDGALHELRAIAPFHGIENGVFDPNYLATYVASVWTAFSNTPVTMNTSAWGVYTGTVTAGSLVFTQSGQTSVAFAEPTTHDVYANSGALAAQQCGSPPAQSCLVQGQLADALAAAFNRTTIPADAVLPACTKREFYRTPPVNEYARAIHAESIRGLAYAFGFDDSCDFSSFVADRAPTHLNVTIEPF
jgi:hypothetical protein